MPVKIKQVDGYQVSHGGKVSAKGTTLNKAKKQRNLLNAVRHGWKPRKWISSSNGKTKV